MSLSPYPHRLPHGLPAITTMAPLWIILSDFLCITSGYFVSVYQWHLVPGALRSVQRAHIPRGDMLIAILKTGVFGVCSCTISCYYGFFAAGGAAGVDRTTHRAVVMRASSGMLGKYGLSEIFYG